MPPCRPSTQAPVPVMKAACLDARNKTGAAASSHVAFRPMGCCTAVFASASALDTPASVARRSAAHQPAVLLVQHQRTRRLFISASALHNLLRGSLQHDGMLFIWCSRARRLLASVSAMRRQAVCRAGTGGPPYAACTRQGACQIRYPYLVQSRVQSRVLMLDGEGQPCRDIGNCSSPYTSVST